MRESKFFQELQEETRIEDRRAFLLETLESRFGGEAAAAVATAVSGLSDLGRLVELNRLAFTCRRLSDFRRALVETTSRK